VSDKLPITESTGSAGNAEYNRVYTQQEVDALIAGAVLAIHKWALERGWKNMAKELLEQNPATADAARLALEEREKEIIADTLRAAADAIHKLQQVSTATDPPIVSYEEVILSLIPAKPLSPIPAEREKKLIADTLRAASDKIDEIIPAEFVRGHQSGDGPRSEIVTKYTRRAVLSILPAHIAVHAEERDRRVIAEALKEYEDDFIHIAEYWNGNENDRAVADALWEMRETAEKALKRIAAYRAAVQEKPQVGTSGNDS
jgi:hypothetical protein